MLPEHVFNATALIFLLLRTYSCSTIGRIIGHPFHSPPWSNEDNLNVNIRAMLERREKERREFDRVHAEELKENIAITVTESEERSGPRFETPDSEEIEKHIQHREILQRMDEYGDESKQVRRQKLAKNVTGDPPIEKFFYVPEHIFHNTFTFTTTSTTTPPPTSTVSTLVYTLKHGFVFEEIVGLISTTPTIPRYPPPRSTEIYPWELFHHNYSWTSVEIKKLWQMNRFTPFLVHFTNSDYQELTTTPQGMSFNLSWEYSDDPCDAMVPYEFRNHTTTPTTYDSHYGLELMSPDITSSY